MGIAVGYAHKLYYNSASYDTPTWVEVPIAKDVKITLAADEADVSTRGGGGWKAFKQGLKEMSFEFSVLRDPESTPWMYLQAAFFAGSSVDFWATDLAEDEGEAQGPRAVCELFKFDQNEALSEGVANDVVAKPTYGDDPPTYYENPS